MLYVLLFILEVFVLFLLSRRLIKKLSGFIYKFTRSQKLTVGFIAFLFLPGTLIHELAHFLTATILFVPTGNISVWPKIEEDGVRLGSVGIGKSDFLRRSVIGFSPFLIGIALILGILFFAYTNNILANELFLLLAGYLVFQIGNTMFSSKKDLEGTWVFFVFLAAIASALYLLNVQITVPNGVFEVVKQANILLLIPIIFDFLLVALLSILIS